MSELEELSEQEVLLLKDSRDVLPSESVRMLDDESAEELSGEDSESDCSDGNCSVSSCR